MKFLVRFTEDTQLAQVHPVTQQLDLVERTIEYLKDLGKKEAILDWGFYGEGQGFYFTCDVRTNAELYEIQERVPLRAICRVEAQPVLDHREYPETFKRIRHAILDNAKVHSKKVVA